MIHCILLPFLCLLVGTHSQSHSLIVGERFPGDQILYEEDVFKEGLPLIVRTSTLDFPKKGSQSKGYIGCIYAIDNENDGTGGYPSIKYGGVGQDFVTIELKSQRGEGLNFTISISGYPRAGFKHQ